MADKQYDPKGPSPEEKHPAPYRGDLNPDAAAGQNWGLVGPHPEKDRDRRAYDVKEAHRMLRDFHDDDLKRITILPPGSRLEAKATYLNLRDPSRKEFTGSADMSAGPDDLIVPKSEIDYPLWNRLIGVTDPARLDKAEASGPR